MSANEAIRIISFDAAGTLLRVNWNPAEFAIGLAEEAGWEFDRAFALSSYQRLLHTRWRDFVALNLRRDPKVTDAWWDELTQDWGESMLGRRPEVDSVMRRARHLLYSADSPIFQPFEDSVAALNEIKSAGYRMIVLSNWDISLHRILAAHGLTHYFEAVFASLEHGPEKPEAELFRIVERSLGEEHGAFLHVGDDPLDDLTGATGAGWKALLLDRSLPKPEGARVATLRDVLPWIS